MSVRVFQVIKEANKGRTVGGTVSRASWLLFQCSDPTLALQGDETAKTFDEWGASQFRLALC